MFPPDRLVAEAAAAQGGAFSRAQAHAVGLSDRQLATRVRNGVLHKVGPNAFRFAGAPRSTLADLSAIVLDVGAPVWVAGWTAAACYGFDWFALREPFHLMVPTNRHIVRPGVEIHRTDDTAPVDTAVHLGLPITTVERTLIDLARTCRHRRLLAALDSSARLRVLDERRLHQRIAALRSQGKYGIPALVDVIEQREATRGSESFLETEYLLLIARAGLPRPDTQQVFDEESGRRIRVDCRFPGTPVVVELLGYAWHRTVAQMNTDAERYNALLARGLRPYQFTYDQVVGAPAHVVATTRAALRLPA